MTAHGITRAVQERASLFEQTPLISPEQAAADKAAFMEKCKDPAYLELGHERRVKQQRQRQRREEARAKKAAERAADFQGRLQEAARLREQGLPDREIVKHVRLGRESIVRHLGEPPVKENAPLPAQLKAEKLERARELYAQGFNYSAIACQVGVSKQSIRTWDLAA